MDGNRKRFFSYLGIALVAFIAGAVLVSLYELQDLSIAGELGESPSKNPVLQEPLGRADDGPAPAPLLPAGSFDVAEIVDRAGPSVVFIETATKVARRTNPFFSDPFFRDFFGDRSGPSEPRIQEGLGTGFVISADGLILTNEHVIQGADEIKVTMQGSEEPLAAEVVGKDSFLDLAVIRVDAGRKLVPLPLGDSEKLRVGEWLVAIGNPYGLDHTVTVGVLSATGRPVNVSDKSYKNLLQTDAAINPGNSGGPLLNARGEVIGINTAVNAAAQGIGFAIPINEAREVIGFLSGQESMPWLGIVLTPVSEDLAAYFKAPDTKGAIITSVLEDGPAAKAGIQRGDIIREFEREPVSDPDVLISKIRERKVGDRVLLLILRNGESRLVTVALGDRPRQ
ncbi:MAG: trypsin-like peptidase domain-containing protein [Firmicutes bacterium]|nr:trypsin-like peptidase domain-containing protein [Bacillota bacterium]